MKAAITLLSVLLATVSVCNAEYKIEEAFDWSGGDSADRLTIINANGDIKVKSGGDTISIKAVKKANSQEYLDKLNVRVDEIANAVELSVDYPKLKELSKKSYDGGGGVDFDITVPAGVYLVIELANGEITTENVSSLEIVLANGAIEAKGAYDKAEIGLANGNILIDNPNEATGSIDAAVANGDIEANFVLPETGGNYDFEVVNGKVAIGLLGGAKNFEFEAATISGKVSADIPLESEKGWVGGEYWAKVGGGDNKISAETVAGKISLKTK